MKVKATKATSFPKLKWAISEGETKDLPQETEAQDRILLDPNIQTFKTEEKEVSKINTKSEKDK